MTCRPATGRGAGGAAAVAAALALAAGCGGTAGDLMAVERTGPAPGVASQRIVVTGDGRGRCGARGPLRQLESATVIEARALERDLGPLAERAAGYAGPAGRARLVARTRAGTVRWVEGAPRLPPVLARTDLFALRVGRVLCARR